MKDEAAVDMVLGVFADIKTPISALFRDSEWESKIEAVLAKVTPKLEMLQNFYGEKEFALGYLTLADFHMAEYSYYFEKIIPDMEVKFPFIKRVRVAFQNLPEIKKYYEQ